MTTTLLIYTHDGNIVLTSRDQPIPEHGQEMGIVNDTGVSAWLTTGVRTEHLGGVPETLAHIELQPI